MTMVVGGILSFILGLIGILNFINTMITSIQARKNELAVLQAVGMTGRQARANADGRGPLLCPAYGRYDTDGRKPVCLRDRQGIYRTDVDVYLSFCDLADSGDRSGYALLIGLVISALVAVSCVNEASSSGARGVGACLHPEL